MTSSGAGLPARAAPAVQILPVQVVLHDPVRPAVRFPEDTLIGLLAGVLNGAGAGVAGRAAAVHEPEAAFSAKEGHHLRAKRRARGKYPKWKMRNPIQPSKMLSPANNQVRTLVKNRLSYLFCCGTFSASKGFGPPGFFPSPQYPGTVARSHN